LRINFEAASEVKAKSGVIFNIGKEVKLSLSKSGSINVNGITISNSTKEKTAILQSVSIGSNNKMNWVTSESIITNAPFSFVTEEFEGKVPSVPSTNVAAHSALQAIGPIKD